MSKLRILLIDSVTGIAAWESNFLWKPLTEMTVNETRYLFGGALERIPRADLVSGRLFFRWSQ